VNGQVVQHTLQDVLFVPSAPNNLLSLSRFDSGGKKVEFSGGQCRLYARDGQLLATATKSGHLYKLNVHFPPRTAAVVLQAATETHSWDEWH
ncbi:hypothetical protein AURDEDRAFT_43222, partial [Auricularia subglabra TFB-10046 SS5]